MNLAHSGIALALLACSSATLAQTTNCMNMGPNMVQCHSTDGASTNCIGMGPDMATCNTTRPAQPAGGADGGALLGNGLVGLVRSIQERSFRKKIGAFLAEGDCAGAIKFAFEKGRVEVGAALMDFCSSPATVAPDRTDVIESHLVRLAELATPRRISGELSLVSAEARGTQIVFNFLSDSMTPDMDGQRAELMADSCGNEYFRELYSEGASMRANYAGPDGEPLGSFLITAGDCGIK